MDERGAGGRLDRVCAKTGKTAACRVLREWDGRSNADSVGTAIFAEFMRLAAADDVKLWEVGFDPSRPLTTPRTLIVSDEVVSTMAKAIRTLTKLGVDLRAPYGTQHYSGDRGDKPGAFPISGGLGNTTGDANATSVSGGEDPIVGGVNVGSSHIQAIAFTGRSGVIARTVLTYGQYEDPSSPWSNDQTRIFSRERWVAFPWTEEQIEQSLVRTVHLSGGGVSPGR